MSPTRTSLALLLALCVAIPAASASAHPRLVKASPAANSRSAEGPRRLALTFNESLDLALTRITLVRGDAHIRLDSLRLAVDDDRTVVAPIRERLAPGRYTVRWQVTGDDGHPVRGEFTFEILAGDPSAAPPARP